MKKKQIIHPRIYIRILEKKSSIVIAEYKSNQFNNSGQRTIKKSKLNLDQYLDNFSNDFKEILDKLNSQELNKIIEAVQFVIEETISFRANEGNNILKDSPETLRKWLRQIYSYANTWSIEKYDSYSINILEMKPGDFFIKSNPPPATGHAVNVVDVVLTINFILDQNNLSEYEQCQADLDQNGIINVVDIVLIVGYILDNE